MATMTANGLPVLTPPLDHSRDHIEGPQWASPPPTLFVNGEPEITQCA